MYQVDASQLDALAAEIVADTARIESKAPRSVRDRTNALANTARALAPVRTGALRAGISSRTFGTTGEVVSSADYSDYVEDGTSDTAPQPFMGPAASLHERGLVADFEQLAGEFL